MLWEGRILIPWKGLRYDAALTRSGRATALWIERSPIKASCGPVHERNEPKTQKENEYENQTELDNSSAKGPADGSRHGARRAIFEEARPPRV